MTGSPDVPSAAVPDWYVAAVRKEIGQLHRYFVRQITVYRALGVVMILCGSSLPVLNAIPEVPRWFLNLPAAVVAALAAVQYLFGFKKSALDARNTANAMERVLNKYQTSAEPYTGPVEVAFPVLVRDIEAIRERADRAFDETWQRAAPPSIERGDGQRSEPEDGNSSVIRMPNGPLPESIERQPGQQVTTMESGPPTKAVGPSSAADSP
jgi:hypothetical protein